MSSSFHVTEIQRMRAILNDLVGPAGPPGPIGRRGMTGDTGEQGVKGDTGEQGVKGDTGEQGVKGDTGEQGVKGDTGEQGVKGDTGEQGVKGDTGEQGVKGDTGEQGVKGDTGEQAIQSLGDVMQFNNTASTALDMSQNIIVSCPGIYNDGGTLIIDASGSNVVFTTLPLIFNGSLVPNQSNQLVTKSYVDTSVPNITATEPINYTGSTISASFDEIKPVDGSSKLLTSGTIFTALSAKINTSAIKQDLSSNDINDVASVPAIATALAAKQNTLVIQQDLITYSTTELASAAAIFNALAAKQDTINITIQQTLQPSEYDLASAAAIFNAISNANRELQSQIDNIMTILNKNNLS